MVEIPSLCFPSSYLMEYQNVKIMKSKLKSENSNKNNHEINAFLKENRKDSKMDIISVI